MLNIKIPNFKKQLIYYISFKQNKKSLNISFVYIYVTHILYKSNIITSLSLTLVIPNIHT